MAYGRAFWATSTVGEDDPTDFVIEIERVNDRFFVVGFDMYGETKGCIKHQLGSPTGYDDPVEAVLWAGILGDVRYSLFAHQWTEEIWAALRVSVKKQLYGDNPAGRLLREKLKLDLAV